VILLWGVGSERPLAAVRDELGRLGARFFLLDQRRALETSIELCAGPQPEGRIRTPDGSVDLASITAVYARPYDVRLVPAVRADGPGSAAWRHALALEEALLCWAELTPALVVNRPSAMGPNTAKPYQLEELRRLGFRVPETLVTTDPEAARRFWERHGRVIYKSISARRSRVSTLRPEHLTRMERVAHCPTQFQVYVPGVDHRVHVVGDELFACTVRCGAEDYRYPDGQAVEIEPCRLPGAVAARCRRVAAAQGLPFAGIDLRRSADGEWYCFEVNPSPAFSYYESETGQPIGRAVARLLVAGACSPRVLNRGGPRGEERGCSTL
jgi:hypothetical protein